MFERGPDIEGYGPVGKERTGTDEGGKDGVSFVYRVRRRLALSLWENVKAYNVVGRLARMASVLPGVGPVVPGAVAVAAKFRAGIAEISASLVDPDKKVRLMEVVNTAMRRVEEVMKFVLKSQEHTLPVFS